MRAFVDELVAEQGFDKRALTRAFAAARYQPRIVAAMDRPLVEPPKWYEYAPQFLTPERIDGGVAFYARNAAALERAEREFGVPADVIVAIIGVETYYGRNLGSYRVFDALTTLAFDYPRRATFFRGELKEFLRLTREQGLSPLAREGLVRRRDGRAAIHARQLSPLCDRLRRRRRMSTCGPARRT